MEPLMIVMMIIATATRSSLLASVDVEYSIHNNHFNSFITVADNRKISNYRQAQYKEYKEKRETYI
jgi:hypothetical protein